MARTSRSASRSSSRDVSRAASPSLVASARAPRRTVRSKTATPAPSESPVPVPELDDIFNLLELPVNAMGAFAVSPEAVADAEHFDAQALSSPETAPPTRRKEIASAGSQKELLRIPHLLRSDEMDLQNHLSSNDAMLAELIAPFTARDIIKLILNKKRVDKTRTAEMEQKDKVIQIREGKIKELDTVIKAMTVRANHAAQNKHLTDEAKQLRVRPPLAALPCLPMSLLHPPQPRLILLPLARSNVCRR